MPDNQLLSVKKQWLWWTTALLILFSAAFFAGGYLYRGQNDRAPIVIEKCSPYTNI